MRVCMLITQTESPVACQLSSPCGKSQVGDPRSCSAPVPLPISLSRRVTLNSHEVLEHSQTMAPCYPARTDGLPTPNLSEETKEDSNRKSRNEEKCTLLSQPPPSLYHHSPPLPVPRPSGTRVDACSKCASSSFGTAKQPSKSEKKKKKVSTLCCLHLCLSFCNDTMYRVCVIMTKL